MSTKFLIAGLGNIGAEYTYTRHNIGFRVIDKLAAKLETTLSSDRLAFLATGKHKGKQLVLIQPTTYMNLSGKAIRYHLDKHNIPQENLLVITDDVALPFGKLRMRPSGSAGGHNGLKNIAEILGTETYGRIRFGVGNDYPKGAQVDYVLGDFSEEQEAELDKYIDKCIEGIISFVSIGLARTMNEFNK